MVGRTRAKGLGPGPLVPARLLAAAAVLAASAGVAAAQGPAPARPAPPPAQTGIPDSIVVHKLIWSIMAALDQANQTGNYSVLRDLGAPAFQANNTAATLGTNFTNLRNQGIDLGYTLAIVPTLQYPPAIVQGGLLRLRGVFPLRPAPIGFDLLFQNIGGQWRIYGMLVTPLVLQTQPSGAMRH